MMVGMLVLAHGTDGMIDASAIRKPANAIDPRRRIGHRTGIAGAPIRQVHDACQ